ncbi:MAG: SpaA isopeptide-forming pilin-related protein, partial [Sporolactobacillus sp.]
MRSKRLPLGLAKTKKRKLFKQLLIIGLSLFVCLSQMSLSPLGRAYADADGNSNTTSTAFVDSVKLMTGNLQSGTEVSTTNPITQGETVNLEYNWSKKADQSFTSGQTMTFKIPDAFKVDQDVTEKYITDNNTVKTSDDQTTIGTLAVTTSDAAQNANTVTVTWNDQASSLSSGATGTIIIPVTYNDSITADETKAIPFDLGNNQTTTVNVALKADASSSPSSSSDASSSTAASSSSSTGASDSSSSAATSDKSSSSSSSSAATSDKSSSSDGSSNDGSSSSTSGSSAQQAEANSGTSGSSSASEQSGTPNLGLNKMATTRMLDAELSTPQPITQNILTGVTLTDANGNPYNQSNPANTDAPATIKFKWAIPDDIGKNVADGDTYVFQLPSDFIMYNDVSGTLDDGSGTSYGTFTVDQNGQVIMKFNSNVATHSNVNGTLTVKTQFNQETITGTTTQKIDFPVQSTVGPVTVYFKPNVDNTIDKSGALNRGMNPTSATWTVNVNKELASVNNAKVTENWPDGISYQSVKVYPLTMNVDGTYTVGNALTSGYSVDSNGNVSFNGSLSTINTAYQLVYQTNIDSSIIPNDGGTVSFTNTATFSGSNLTGIPASAKLQANYGQMLDKQKTGYDPDKQTFSWKINYNFGEKNIDKSDANVSDSFDTSKMSLVTAQDDQLQVQEVTSWNSDGTPATLSDPLSASAYTLTQTASGFSLQFDNGIDSAYVITYKTKVNDNVIIDADQIFNNTANSGTYTSGTSGTASQVGLIKGFSNVNYTNKTVDWSLTVNKNNYQMTNWTLDDTFTSGGQQLLNDTNYPFTIKDTTKNVTLNEGSDYTLTLTPKNADGTGGFSVSFINGYNPTSDTFEIDYTTKFNTDFSNSPSSTKVWNSADATWTDQWSISHTNHAENGFDVNNQTQYNGFKSGEYNPATKEITWKVGVNYNGQKANNAYLTDPITGNQVFTGTQDVSVVPYTINSDGSITEDDAAALSSGEYSATFDKVNKILTVQFNTGADDTKQYMVIFKTTLSGQVVNGESTYSNVATYHSDGYPDQPITGTVSIAHGGELVTKGGVQSGNYIDWTINVNASQSNLSGVTLTDTPTATSGATSDQIIDKNSFTVYPAKVDSEGNVETDSNGNLIADTSNPVPAGDYSLNLPAPDNATGYQAPFTLTFQNALSTITSAYVVQYKALINISGSGGGVSNQVSLNATNQKSVTQDNSKTVTTRLSSGSGSGTGVTGSLNIYKTDLYGNSQAATFQLWSDDGNTLLRQGTTDSKTGQLLFGGLRYGNYILKETNAPSGYQPWDSQYTVGKEVTINDMTSAAGAQYQIKNYKPHAVVLTKIDAGANAQGDSTKPLAGAVYQLCDSTGTPLSDVPEQTTDSNGQLIFDNLAEGQTYELKEISAPTNYKLMDTNPLSFTVSSSDSNIINITATDKMIPGSVELTKYGEDSSGNSKVLQGASFELQYTNGSRALDNDGNSIADKQTGLDGTVLFNNLRPGSYQLVETAAPSGYILNTYKIPVTIDPSSVNPNLTVVQKSMTDFQTGSVTFKKTDASGTGTALLPGAIFEFQQYLNNRWTSLTTNDVSTALSQLTTNGTTTISNLAPGLYRFIEDSAPAGYIKNTLENDFDLTSFNSGATNMTPNLHGSLKNYQGTAELHKTYSGATPTQGAKFAVYKVDGDGNNAGAAVQTGLTPDSTGNVVAKGLEAGQTYRFVETDAGTGYIQNTEILPSFTISKSASGVPTVVTKGDNGALLSVENYQGSATLTKEKADGSPLAGATFKVVDKNGNTVESNLTSDPQGLVTAPNLAPGDYSFVETSAAPGYVLNTEAMPFTIGDSASGKPAVVSAGELKNYQGSATLTKEKADGSPLAGATFKVVDKNGNTVESNLISDPQGLVTAPNLAPGDYSFMETSAAPGYVLNTEAMPFTIGDSASGKPAVVSAGELKNYQGSATLTKEKAD